MIRLLEALSVSIGLDKLTFSKSTSKYQAESRLILAASQVKSIIIKVISLPQFHQKLKIKEIHSIINILVSNIVQTNTDTKLIELFEPTSYNLSVGLNSFLQNQFVRDSLLPKDYDNILSFTFDCLDILTQQNVSIIGGPSLNLLNTEKLIVEFLNVVSSFIDPLLTDSLIVFSQRSSSFLENHYDRILRIISNYAQNLFNSTKRESRSLIIIFQILSKSIVDLSCLNIKQCYICYKVGLQFFLFIKNISFDALKEQIFTFLNVASDFIVLEDLPKILGDNWNINSLGQLTSLSENSEQSVVITSSAEGEDDSFLQNTQPNNDPSSSGIIMETLTELNSAISLCFEFISDDVQGLMILSQSCVDFKLFPVSEKAELSFISFRNISLLPSGNKNAWMCFHVLSKLIYWYYELRSRSPEILETVVSTRGRTSNSYNTQESSQSRKRAKLSPFSAIDYSINDSLKQCKTSQQFIFSLLSYDLNQSKNIVCMGLKLYLFTLSLSTLDLTTKSNYDMLQCQRKNCNAIFDTLLKVFELQDPELNFWIFACLETLLSNLAYASHESFDSSIKLKSSLVGKILKYSLEMIKVPDLSRASSIVLVRLTTISQNNCDLVSLSQLDSSIIQQYETLIDLAEINGPAAVSKESILFWFSTFKISKILKFRNMNMTSNSANSSSVFNARLKAWIMSKISQVPGLTSSSDIYLLGMFFLWISGSHITISSSIDLHEQKDIYSDDRLFFRWQKMCELKNYNLFRRLQSSNIQYICDKDFEVDALRIDINNFRDIISPLFQIVKGSESDFESGYTFYKFLLCFSRIAYSSSDSDHFSSFKYQADQIWTDEFSNLDGKDYKLNIIRLLNQLEESDAPIIDKILDNINMKKLEDQVVISARERYNKKTNVESGSSKCEFDTEIYQPSTKNAFIEHEVLSFLIKHVHRDYSPAHTMNICISFLERTENPSSILKGFLILLDYLDGSDTSFAQEKKGVDARIIDRCFELFATILEKSSYQRCELTLLSISRFLNTFSKLSLVDYRDQLSIPFLDFFKYLFDLTDKKLIFSENVYLEVIRLLLKVYNYGGDVVLVSQEDLLNTALERISKASNFIKIELFKDIPQFIKDSQEPELELYPRLCDCFNRPQSSVESTSAFNQFCTVVSQTSEVLLVSCIFNLLELINFPHFKAYLKYSLQDIALINGCANTKILFINLRDFVLKAWWDSSYPLEQFPYDLVGFGSFRDFVVLNYRELIAISISHKNNTSNTYLNSISRITEMDIPSLISDSLSLIISMAFSKSGIKSDVFNIIHKILGASAKPKIKEQIVLIVYKIMRLCVISDELKLFDIVAPNEDSYLLIDKMKPSLNTPDQLSISISTAHQLVSSFLEKYSGDSFWSVKSMYFLSSKIFLLIDSSKRPQEIILHLRKLKMLILQHEKCIVSKNIVNLYTRALMPYLENELLHEEVCRVFHYLLLKNSVHLNDADSTASFWIPFLVEILRLKVTKKQFYQPFMDYILQNVKAEFPENSYRYLIRAASDTIHGRISHLTTQQVSSSLLKAKSDDTLGDVSELLSFVFQCNEDFVEEFTNVTENNQILEVLHEVYSNSIVYSDNFNLWIGKYIGVSYSTSGLAYTTMNNEFDSQKMAKYLGNFQEESALLNVVFQQAVSVSMKFDIKSKSCLETMIGVLIERKGKSASSVESVLSFDEFTGYEEYILPMSTYVFALANSDTDDSYFFYNDSFEKSLMGFSSYICFEKFGDWSVKIFFGLINDLQSHTSVISLLATFVKIIPQFIEEIFPYLLIFFISKNLKRANNMVKEMVNDFFAVDNKHLSKESIEVFLRTVLLIRIGGQLNIRKYSDIYNELDHKKIYFMAIKAGFPKTALLIFEDYHTNSEAGVAEGWADEKETLKSVYELIDESDLIFGLPTDPTLEYGLKMISQNYRKEQEMMFNTADFDVSLSMSQPLSRKENLLDNMSSIGVNGLAKVLDSYNDGAADKAMQKEDEIEKERFYESAWKLNQWDLPPVIDSKSEHQSIYSCLKMIHDSPLQRNDIINNSILNVTKNRKKFVDSNSEIVQNADEKCWYETLAVLTNFENILTYTDENINGKLEEYLETSKWYNNKQLLSFENIILSRKAFYEICTKFENDQRDLSDMSYWLLAIFELHRYGDLCVFNDEVQRSINSAVYIDRIVSNKFDSSNVNKSTLKFVDRLAKFNISRAFWGEKTETSFPIGTLKSLIKSDEIDPINYEELHIRKPYLSNGLLNAIVAKWSAESKLDTSENIINNYILPEASKFQEFAKSDKLDANMYHMFAAFCDEQLRSGEIESVISAYDKTARQKKKDLMDLDKFMRDESKPRHDRKDAHRVFKRLEIQYKAEILELKKHLKYREKCTHNAVDFYLKSLVLGDDHDATDTDRFCALWLENSDHIVIDSELLMSISSHKFIQWASQLISRLFNENTKFQDNLKNLLLKVTIDYPLHLLYLLKSLKLSLVNTKDALSLSRGKAAEDIWRLLEFDKRVIERWSINFLKSVDDLCDNCVTMAKEKVGRSSKIKLKTLSNGLWWMHEVSKTGIPPPTVTIPIKKTGFYNMDELITIKQVETEISVASSGISLPKIMRMYLSNGKKHTMLLKSGTDDLRQDAIMEQVFDKVNLLFQKDNECLKRKLRVRTYKVIPLGFGTGVIEFVDNSIPLNDILRNLHKVNDKMSLDEARNLMKKTQSSSYSERYKAYKMITNEVSPVLRLFFYNNFLSPDDWFESRVVYSHGIATTSITGYILGLGDRHNNNILLEKSYGEPIHIDLGVAFDQGKALPIPETVPFRLTRDIVDGLGITGVDGIFTKTSEHVFRVLRENRQYIEGILDVLKYDPLYSWTLSPVRKQKIQEQLNDYKVSEEINKGVTETKDGHTSNSDNNGTSGNAGAIKPNGEGIQKVIQEDGSEASIAIESVKNKLTARGLSNEAVVRELIREAVSEKNLCLIYLGWCPFY